MSLTVGESSEPHTVAIAHCPNAPANVPITIVSPKYQYCMGKLLHHRDSFHFITTIMQRLNQAANLMKA